MNQNQIYSIGEMAKICGTSTHTLRHYDKMDLIKPRFINDETKYRYYTSEQIVNLKIIQKLRAIDIPLEKIKEIISGQDIDYIKQSYMEKKEEIEVEIKRLNTKLKRIENEIKDFELLNTSRDGEINIRNIEERTVAFTRCNCLYSYQSAVDRYNEITKMIQENNWITDGKMICIFHTILPKMEKENADIEVCIPIENNDLEHNNIKKVKGGIYATIIHKGYYDTKKYTYKKLSNWCKNNGYKLNGPGLEVHIIDTFDTLKRENFITEIQVPIEKIEHS